ncbi:MAG TPA: hypothetical protein VEC06_18805 [Paucimonas sp.]|nr:hypothetical protein [Paucimonas sp.]
MLARVITVYLAALFVCGGIATLVPSSATATSAARTHRAAMQVRPFQEDVKARAEHAILRDRLASPEDRANDGIEGDARDRMKYRPLSSPMT